MVNDYDSKWQSMIQIQLLIKYRDATQFISFCEVVIHSTGELPKEKTDVSALVFYPPLITDHALLHKGHASSV